MYWKNLEMLHDIMAGCYCIWKILWNERREFKGGLLIPFWTKFPMIIFEKQIHEIFKI